MNRIKHYIHPGNLLLFWGFLFHLSLSAQEKAKKLPTIQVETMEGQTISTSEFHNNGSFFILTLWSVRCAHCREELSTINDVYDDWVDETGVKLIAVSIDDSRLSSNVRPHVEAQDWKFEIYLDKNSDLKRALSVGQLPYTAVVSADHKILFERFSYTTGDEEDLFEFLQTLN